MGDVENARKSRLRGGHPGHGRDDEMKKLDLPALERAFKGS
jgi:hypothetical protein